MTVRLSVRPPVRPIERPPLADDPQEQAERRRAARFLLMHPIVGAHGPHTEELRLIRRQQKELTQLFAHGVGYRLSVDPSGARLFKAGLGRDSSRGLRRRSHREFTPRAYALFCLTVAALARSKTQLLVDELVSQIRSAAVDAELDIDLDAASDRRALHAALTALLDLGVLWERDGDLEHWVEQRTQSLLDVRRDLLAQLVSAPLSSSESPDDLLDQAGLPSAVGGARVAVRRRLLESPVLSVEDLTIEQAEWWSRNRNREREWFHDGFGLELELRSEGAIGIDPDDGLSDEEFPGRGGPRHLALLLLEVLVSQVRASVTQPAQAWHGIPTALVRPAARALVDEWAPYLRADQRDDPEHAVEAALRLITDMGLARRDPPGSNGDDDLIWVHAAAARYAPKPQLSEGSTTGERSLFDEGEDEG